MVGKVIRIVCGLWLLGMIFNEATSVVLHRLQETAVERAEVEVEKEQAIAQPAAVATSEFLTDGYDPWGRRIWEGPDGKPIVARARQAELAGWGAGQVLPETALAAR